MRSARTAPALALCVVLTGLVLPGCFDVLQPCPDRFDIDQNLTTLKRIDGSWFLRTIDGQSIPEAGYRLPPDPKKPLDPPKFLQFGQLIFSTNDAGFDNKCENLTRSDGDAVASYGLTNISTTRIDNIDRKNYTGRFHYDAERGTGYMGAGKYEVPMVIDYVAGLAVRITIRAEVDIFITTVTYTLVFQR